MNINTKNKEIPERALELIPWFITGQLSIEDKTYLEEVLNENEALQSLMDEEREIYQQVTEDKSLLVMSTLESPESRLDSVLSQLDETSPATPSHTSKKTRESFFGKLSDKINFWLPAGLENNGYARFASVALLVASLAVLTAFIAPLFNGDGEFTPAASKGVEQIDKQSSTVLFVGINGTPDSLHSHPLLKGKIKKIEVVPSKKGMYRLSFNKKLDNDQVKEVLSTLSSNKELIWFAGEAY